MFAKTDITESFEYHPFKIDVTKFWLAEIESYIWEIFIQDEYGKWIKIQQGGNPDPKICKTIAISNIILLFARFEQAVPPELFAEGTARIIRKKKS